MPRIIKPHNPYKHDEYEDHHEHDSSDSDSDHEQDHSDDEGEHHHDDHSEHHHHHTDLVTDKGTKIKLNVFHHDPDHGTKPKHIHKVQIRDAQGVMRKYNIFHEGWTHTDVPATHPHAHLYNSPVIQYLKPLNSLPPVEAVSMKTNPVLIPSEDHSPPSYSEAIAGNPYHLFAHHERILPEPEEENCCTPCVIM